MKRSIVQNQIALVDKQINIVKRSLQKNRNSETKKLLYTALVEEKEKLSKRLKKRGRR